MSPHQWIEHNETMPPTARCSRCGCVRMFNREKGTVYTIPKLDGFQMTSEPQCEPILEWKCSECDATALAPKSKWPKGWSVEQFSIPIPCKHRCPQCSHRHLETEPA